MGHFVLPGEAEDATEASEVISVEFFLLACIRCPRFANVEQNSKDACIVYSPVYLDSQLGNCPYFGCEAHKC